MFCKNWSIGFPIQHDTVWEFFGGPYHFRKTPPLTGGDGKTFRPYHSTNVPKEAPGWKPWSDANGQLSRQLVNLAFHDVSWFFFDCIHINIYIYIYIISVCIYIYIYVVWPCGCSVLFISNIIPRAFGASSQSSHVLRMGWNMSKPSAISIKKSTKHRSWELWAQLIWAFWAICDVLSEDVVVLPTAEMFYIDLECFLIIILD